MTRFWLALGLALLVAWLPQTGSAQSDGEKAQSQLRQLQKDIKRINRDIANANARRSKLQQQLRGTEVTLGKIQASITRKRGEINEQKTRLAGLEDQRRQLQESSEQQQVRVAAEMQAAWKMGLQGQLKVLLNQESPHTLARNMRYYRYFLEARSTLLTRYRQTLAELAEVEQQIESNLAQLESRQQSLEEQQQKLASAQENRALAVAELNRDISSKSRQLKKMELDRRELEKLLQAIEEAVVNLQVPENYQPFSAAKGKMPWPLAGKASNRYGQSRNDSGMRWQGLTIPAKEGATINAIHHGRVVYADWFRGSGLLLIIDHGEGYMSLYAHNQSLLREVGEWVSAGTAVSTAGSSGGLDKTALYFEIRHNGKPTDPKRWCTKSR